MGEQYRDHLLRVGEKREEFHALLNGKMQKSAINNYYDKINKSLFKLRNDIAHGKENSDSIVSRQYIKAFKTTIEFMWDLDRKARPLLIPIMHQMDASGLIDQQIIRNCGSNSDLTLLDRHNNARLIGAVRPQ